MHNHWKFKRFLFAGCYEAHLVNVGVDVWNFYPQTFEELIKEYNKWRKNENKT